MSDASLTTDLAAVDAFWRAANYLAVGQIFLRDNALLRRALRPSDIKPRLLGHWGTCPGLSLVHAHVNRVICRTRRQVLMVHGPGHGGPAAVACAWLDGTYSEVYPDVSMDELGMQRLFKQFSFPGGIPSHVAPETPGSVHEGGELGYCLAHAYGAAFDNPDLLVCCIVGDGEFETGALAASWHSNKFVNPIRDGAVLPILHLNGFKIANPTIPARISRDELTRLLEGLGHHVRFVVGDDPSDVHRQLASSMDWAINAIREIQVSARMTGTAQRPRWPLIVLDTPKGWTGPLELNGEPIEGSHRSHQVPLKDVRTDPHQLAALEVWMRSYRPEMLFGADGSPVPRIRSAVPVGDLRPSACPHANGGQLLRPLRLPEPAAHATSVAVPGTTVAEATRVMGAYLRDVMELNRDAQNFRVFGPDETASNRWTPLFDVTDRVFLGRREPTDDHLSDCGRVMEILSEHVCEGWLEGYLLTGRHGFFSCYEAFVHIVDSMFNQHAKWLKTSSEIPWREPVASLNYLLTSHVWRQDHNGFSHQDPGFLDHVVNKKASIVRVYLPPDANTLLWVTKRCLESRDKVNVVVAGKQPELQWLDIHEARRHVERGAGLWQWACTDADAEPDVVLACAGDVPTLETLAATSMLRRLLPELRVRVVNVVDLMTLQSAASHPHGLSDSDFDDLFTEDKPVLFQFHGYPWLIHRLTYRRRNHRNFHVKGYREEGTTTTPFDMVVLNGLDRFHIVRDVAAYVPGLGAKAAYVKHAMDDALARHHSWIRAEGVDLPEVTDWRWDGNEVDEGA